MSKSLRTLKGVGEKTEKLFQKVGIFNTEDLIRYYPRNYDEYEDTATVADLKEGTVKAVSAFVCSGVYVNSVRGKQVISITAGDETGRVGIVWFNTPYLKNTLKKGACFVFRGRVIRRQGKLQMEHPEIYTPAAYKEILHSLQPVYALTAGLSNKTIVKMVQQLLKDQEMRSEYLSHEIREKYHLSDINYALRTIHFPEDREELMESRKRLVFDEFLFFILAVQLLKEKTEVAENLFPMKKTWTTEQVIENLPYRLTDAQLNTWHEIERDLSGQALMSRLVQGDVGSGKTILAFLAMILTCENGYQAALMVPTEVLARQHFEAFQKLLQEQGLDIDAVLLTGSNTAKEKRLIYEKIREGKASVIIGTHALIQEAVEYQNLALVITDEQHRFGVGQRAALADKGSSPHLLVMSATPIPRTLALMIYGDLDISILDELPPGRQKIKTYAVGSRLHQRVYNYIKKHLDEGLQAYIVCPLVEEGESELTAAQEYAEKLQKGPFRGYRLGLLHGRMKPKEKEETMRRFAANDIQLLVSTTVVEVGVDVPNAVVMVIENAERFGLSQLHQLRGRVGRGRHPSTCILISDAQNEQAKQRLQTMCDTTDGFQIADADLKMRGPGDFFGARQHGLPALKIANMVTDLEELKQAQQAAREILKDDPGLQKAEHQGLRAAVEQLFQTVGETGLN